MLAISSILEIGLEKNPHKVAIYYYDDTYTYLELEHYVGCLANGLANMLNLKKGDVLAIQSSNTIEFVFTLLACWRIGIAITPINPALKMEEIKYQLENSDAACFIYEGYVAEKAREAVAAMSKSVKQVIFKEKPSNNELSFDSLFSRTASALTVIPSDTIALIIYTSGTTGKPKGVLLNHHNVSVMTSMIADALQVTEQDRSFLILPMFHVNGIMFTLTLPLSQNGSAVIRHKFVLEEFLECIDRFQPTYTSAVPTIYKLLTNLPTTTINKYNLNSLRFGICGAAPMSISDFERFAEKFSFPLIEGWGLSEGSVASTLNPLNGARKIGSIGIPLPGQEVKIIDEEGNEQKPHEKGELVVRGENIMRGYLNNPEATLEVLKDGWLKTGDIGYQDEDGYFYIVDRKKDIIIRGGINIYPKEVEEAIYQMPDVLEAAVVGQADEKYGEEVLAFVSLKKDSQISPADVITHCKQKLANYKCPKQVIIIDSLPKNSVGKITKNDLRRSPGSLIK